MLIALAIPRKRSGGAKAARQEGEVAFERRRLDVLLCIDWTDKSFGKPDFRMPKPILEEPLKLGLSYRRSRDSVLNAKSFSRYMAMRGLARREAYEKTWGVLSFHHNLPLQT